MPGDEGEPHRMDLLTVLMHELGHVLGYDHQEDGVMAEALAAGDRLAPIAENAFTRGTSPLAEGNAIAAALALDTELRHKR